MKIPIIILAAGSSSRLGQPKQLLPWQNSTLIELTVNVALSADSGQVYVVTGASSDIVAQKIDDSPVIIVKNTRFEEGISTSIQTGLNRVLEDLSNTEAVILCLCDQPYISRDIFIQLVASYHQSGFPLVHCRYNRLLTGPPALIDQKYFPYLRQLTGDAGAKKLFMQHPDDVAVIDFPKGEVDIDTWLDYQSLR